MRLSFLINLHRYYCAAMLLELNIFIKPPVYFIKVFNPALLYLAERKGSVQFPIVHEKQFPWSLSIPMKAL